MIMAKEEAKLIEPAEKEEKKERKPKPVKKKKESKPRPYKKLRNCPKCGPGVRLAEHANRYACGRCGYMEKKG